MDHCVLVLAVCAAAWVRAEVFDETCYELGKQWVYEAKDMLLCDRTGRRINLNKFCKARLSAATGRLIIDNSKDDGPTETKKQVGHFPELCLPGQRSYAMQAPFLCTCVLHRGRHRWECVVPEGGAGHGQGGESPSRMRRSADAGVTMMDAEDVHNASVHADMAAHGRAMVTLKVTPSMTTPAPPSTTPWGTTTAEDAGHNGMQAGEARVLGRQAAPYRPNIVIDFCDEFGYVHTVSSTLRDCSCDKDVVASKLFSFRDNDLYHSGGLFATYECLPGTYSVRCEVCYPESHTCQPTSCP